MEIFCVDAVDLEFTLTVAYPASVEAKDIIPLGAKHPGKFHIQAMPDDPILHACIQTDNSNFFRVLSLRLMQNAE